MIFSLIGSLHEKSRVEGDEISVVEISSKLETAITAKQESEAKAMTLEEKVKKYEDDIAVMKEKVNSIVILHVFIYHDLIKGTYMYNDEI